MKSTISAIAGVLVGLIVMYFMRPLICPPQEKIKIVKQVQYETKWKVKREISYIKAKECVFSPIIIEAEEKKDIVRVTASDGCKESKKDIKIEQDESYLEEALLAVGGIALGLITGVVISGQAL